ncbi:unnamed protein product [Closterium sp. NIES-65]|nr:unnamed protein product [Closterium sp. NIES-65]
MASRSEIRGMFLRRRAAVLAACSGHGNRVNQCMPVYPTFSSPRASPAPVPTTYHHQGDGRPFWRHAVAMATGSDNQELFEDLYQVGGYQVGGYQVGGYQVGGYQVGGYQVGGYQVGGYQVGGYQVGGYQMGGYQVGEYQVGGYQVGGYQVGGYQVGGYQVGGYQVGGYQVGGYQVGGYQVGRYQVGGYQVGRYQVGGYQVGRYQVGRYQHYEKASAWRVAEGAVDSLLRLKQANVRLAIVSNFDSRLRPILRDLQVDSLFDAIVVSAEVRCEKPSPQIFAIALEEIGVSSPGRAVHVGDDAVNDLQGAMDAGLHAWLWKQDVKSFDDITRRVLGI